MFITILKSDKRKLYWKAVQWAPTLDAIRAKRTYKAGVSLTVPKGNDTYIEDKRVIEEITQLPANAEVYKVEGTTARSIRRASL